MTTDNDKTEKDINDFDLNANSDEVDIDKLEDFKEKLSTFSGLEKQQNKDTNQSEEVLLEKPEEPQLSNYDIQSQFDIKNPSAPCLQEPIVDKNSENNDKNDISEGQSISAADNNQKSNIAEIVVETSQKLDEKLSLKSQNIEENELINNTQISEPKKHSDLDIDEPILDDGWNVDELGDINDLNDDIVSDPGQVQDRNQVENIDFHENEMSEKVIDEFEIVKKEEP